MAELEEGIESFIKTLMIKRFPDEPFKHTVKKTDKGLRFYCPYCGDTHTVNATPRGNLYSRSKRYRCFNGGCFTSVSLSNFILKWSNEYSIDINNIDFNEINLAETENQAYNNLVATKDNTIYDYLEDMDLLQKLPTVQNLMYWFGLMDIRYVAITTNTFKFLNNRCAYSIPDIHRRVFADRSDRQIYILNIDDKTDRVLSFATRSVVGKKIYIIKMYSDFLKFWKPDTEIKQEDIDFLDLISSYYNILNIDFEKPINITEGQFDAMFLDNYLAIQGSTKIGFVLNHIKSDKINILFDRDSAGFASVAKMIKKTDYNILKWTEIIENLKKKFWNDIQSINKIHDINELFNFLYSKSNNCLTKERFAEYISTKMTVYNPNPWAVNNIDVLLL